MKKISISLSILAFAFSAYSQTASDYFFEAMKKRNPHDAITGLTKAIDIDPNFGAAYSERGKSKVDLEDYRGAINDFTKAIEIGYGKYDSDPDYYSYLYCTRGICKKKLKDDRGAIIDFTKAIEIYPNYENAYLNRGNAKGNLEDFRGAISDFNNVIRLNPENSDAYRKRGLARVLSGQKENGCLDLSKAGELGSTSAYDLIKQYCN